ncbi:DUF3618 domain-containing protein [Nocardioides aquiterrae]|uniref:DUF3618 domain-containing protein n=1 Tax=Nocardioides aquiterrae TaxID=203799 RepID=A0ABN1USY3_9ACTN
MSSNGTTPQQIEADIARQREQLAATIDQLHDTLQDRARTTARVATIVAAAGAVAIVGLLVWRRTHH